MMKLFFFEWKKLCKQKLFWLFTAVLLLGNIFFLYQYESQQDVYQFCHVQKEEWQNYLDGDEQVTQKDFYAYLVEKERQHVAFYDEFLQQIPKQAEQFKQTDNYQVTDTFLYRNLEKTVSDYESLSSNRLEEAPSVGEIEFSRYEYSIYFVFLFLFVVSYFMISLERKQGLFLLSKGTKQGHAPLAISKIGVMVTASTIYVLVQECINLGMFGYFYGYDNLGRLIQSISVFRNCTWAISVWQGIAWILVGRVGVTIICALFCAGFMFAVQRESIAWMFYIVFLGIEGYMYQTISLNSSWHGLKNVNLFFIWSTEQMFGVYQNLNILGYPFCKEIVCFVVWLLVSCLLMIMAVYGFSKRCQISKDSLLEKIRNKWAEKMSFCWHHTSVFRFEFRKVFWQEKKGILIILLVVLCILGVNDAMRVKYYAQPRDAEYHRILSEISGKVTKKSLSYIKEQRKEIDQIYEELGKLNEDQSNSLEIKKIMLQHELETREDGVALVEEQRDLLFEKEGNIYDKYWIDEKKYVELFTDYVYELLVFFVSMSIAVLWMSGLEAVDEKKGISQILYTTYSGKKIIQRKKWFVGFVGVLLAIICGLLPQIIRYANVEQFRTMGQSMRDITMLNCNASISLGKFLVIVWTIKAFLEGVVGAILLFLVRKIQNIAMIIGIGVGTVGLAVLLLLYCNMDVTIFVLKKLMSM